MLNLYIRKFLLVKESKTRYLNSSVVYGFGGIIFTALRFQCYISYLDTSHTPLFFRSSEMMVTSVFQFLPTHAFRFLELLVKSGVFIIMSRGTAN